MATGLTAYRQVLADPWARAFSAAGFVARLPLSMTGLGIVLLVSLRTGSYGRAGLVTACGTVAGAVCAPLWGRLMDRVGQTRVLLAASLINAVSVSGLITSVLRGWPLPVTLAAAVGVGVGFSSAGSAVRARWSDRLGDAALLNTAFALEAVLDEVVFIVGPVLVTFLATSLQPAVGLGVSGFLGLVGALALAAQRRTQPPVHVLPQNERRLPLPLRTLLPVVAACVALGAIFGAMEVVVVAFAKAAGVLPYAGLILMCWAFGSLLAGVVTGARSWRAPPATRFRTGAVLLACSLLPLPFVTAPGLTAALLAVSGMAIAPTLIASVAVVQGAVPASRLTEALSWNSTGLAAGLAAGAAAAGPLIDAYGAGAGFYAPLGAGLLLVLTVLLVRGGRPAAGGQSPFPAATAAAAVSRAEPDTPAVPPSHPSG